jgi:hypothetical protein
MSSPTDPLHPEDALPEPLCNLPGHCRLAIVAHTADAVQRALAAQQPLPSVSRVIAGHEWDGERQQHTPTLLVYFAPVAAGEPNDAKSWLDRDRLALALAQQEPGK